MRQLGHTSVVFSLFIALYLPVPLSVGNYEEVLITMRFILQRIFLFCLCVWAWECVLLFNIGFSVFGAFSFLLTQLVVYIWNVESFEFSTFSTYICLVRLIWFVSIKRVARFERSLNSSVNYTFWVFSIFKTILYNARGFTIRCWYSTAFWLLLL